jgi:hypothetical protein
MIDVHKMVRRKVRIEGQPNRPCSPLVAIAIWQNGWFTNLPLWIDGANGAGQAFVEEEPLIDSCVDSLPTRTLRVRCLRRRIGMEGGGSSLWLIHDHAED